MAAPTRFELAAFRSTVGCSDQLELRRHVNPRRGAEWGSLPTTGGEESWSRTFPLNHELSHRTRTRVAVATRLYLTESAWHRLHASYALRAGLRATRCSATGMGDPVGPLVSVEGLEPPTTGSQSRRPSSWASRWCPVASTGLDHVGRAEPEPGIEPGPSGYEADALSNALRPSLHAAHQHSRVPLAHRAFVH